MTLWLRVEVTSESCNHGTFNVITLASHSIIADNHSKFCFSNNYQNRQDQLQSAGEVAIAMPIVQPYDTLMGTFHVIIEQVTRHQA